MFESAQYQFQPIKMQIIRLFKMFLIVYAGLLLSPIAYAQSITPDAVKELQQKKASFIFYKVSSSAENQPFHVSQNKELKTIYFSEGFPEHQVRFIVEKNRDAGVAGSYWLTGTPVEWQEKGLNFPQPLIFNKRPQAISSRVLADAIKDDVPLEIIDLRPEEEYRLNHIKGARQLMPHQVTTQLSTFPKNRWLVFVDAGGRVGETIASEMIARGYPLSVHLRGGFPAWLMPDNK